MVAFKSFRADNQTLNIYHNAVELINPRYSATATRWSIDVVQKTGMGQLQINAGRMELTYRGSDSDLAYEAVLEMLNR